MKTFSRIADLNLRNCASVIIVFLIISSLFVMTTGLSISTAGSHHNANDTQMGHYTEKPGKGLNPVNPYSLYRSEPAPMGIADYGIGPNNSPYAYNTTSFLGVIKIGSLSVVNNNTSSRSLSFQLNVNLEFNNSGIPYVYWVQDVFFLNTSTNAISFIDNIWNMSSEKSSSCTR